MKIPVYNLKGEKVETLELPESIFGLPWNPDLVHQVVESMRSNLRKNTAHAKTRAEVSGGGRKPWRQKGTGRARHGSIRSPIWIGGGVAHGPLSLKKYEKKINKKAKQKAFLTVLSKKYSEGQILIMDKVMLGDKKTKNAKLALENLGRIKGFEGLAGRRLSVVVSPEDRATALAFRNLDGVQVAQAKNLNPLILLSAKYLILGKDDIKNIKA